MFQEPVLAGLLWLAHGVLLRYRFRARLGVRETPALLPFQIFQLPVALRCILLLSYS